MALGGITMAKDALQSDIYVVVQRLLKWQTNEHAQEHTIIYNETVKLYFRVKDSKQ
jgi:hypothetical protein